MTSYEFINIAASRICAIASQLKLMVSKKVGFVNSMSILRIYELCPKQLAVS
jgi:hypothetical protein